MKKRLCLFCCLVLIVISLTSCGTGRTYGKSGNFTASVSGGAVGNNTYWLTDKYSSITYIFESKDKVIFELVGTTGNEDRSDKLTGIVVGDIKESEYVDVHDNSKYTDYQYIVNLISEKHGWNSTYVIYERVSQDKEHVSMVDIREKVSKSTYEYIIIK